MGHGGLISRAGLTFGLAFALGTTFGAVLPAAAGDDGSGNLFDSVTSFVGLQGDKDKETLDYRARAPLVIPKEKVLPAPQAASAKRRENWPVDPDVQARRKEVEERNKPAPQIGYSSSGRISKEELLAGRAGLPDKETRTTDCLATSGTASCVYSAWDKLKAKVSGADEKDIVVGGVEPTREYLTEPPSGYRRAVTTTRVQTAKGGVDAPDAGDAAAYARANSRHKYSVDE